MLDNPYASPTEPTGTRRTPLARFLAAGVLLAFAVLSILPFLAFAIVIWPSGWSDARSYVEIAAVWITTSLFAVASSGFVLLAVGVLNSWRTVTGVGLTVIGASVALYVAIYILAH